MKKRLLQKALSKKLMDRMVLINETDLYNGYYIQLRKIANKLKKRDSFSRLFVKRPGASNHKAPVDSVDWEPFIGQVAAVVNNAVEERKLCAKWVTEKKLIRKKEEKLCFCYNESGYRARNCLYLPAKRPTAPAEVSNKKKAIKIIAANNKKAARPQVKKVLDSEPVNASDSENK